MRVCQLLAVLSFIGLAGASAQNQQDARIHIAYEDLTDEHLDLSTVPWKFHPGDLEGAADPLLDDSGWPLIWTELRSDSLSTALFEEEGWFRLDVTLDSMLTETGFAVSVFQGGNVELYWNGENLIEAGRRGTAPRGGAARITTGVPSYVTAPDRSDGVLAVRFDARGMSDQLRKALDDRVRLSPGFAVVIGRIEAMAMTYSRRWIKVNEFTFAMGVMLALSLLHLLMYRRRAGEIAHLYFGLSVLFMLPPIFLFGVTFVPSSGAFYVSGDITTIVWRYSYLGAQLLWLASIHSLLRNRLGRRYWTVVLLLIALPLLFDAGLPGLSVDRVIFGIAVISTVDAIAVTFMAIRRNQTDALVLAAGFVGALVGTFLFRSQVDSAFAFYRTGILGETFFLSLKSIPIWLYFLSTPIAMTVLLSKRYVESRVNLRETVEKRTSDLRTALADVRRTQAQLVQQEKMASLGSLTSGIAHEVKNPLNFVNNFAEVTNELTDELREALARGNREEVEHILQDIARNTAQIEKHGKRADSIIRSMMDHASGAEAREEEVTVNEFVDEYVNLAWHGARATSDAFQVDIQREFDENAGSVSVLPQELGRVLVNLLNNAFDAVRETANPVVRVETKRVPGFVCISVADNGPGIPEDVRSKIFEPFFTTKPPGKGTGLGLSMSYDIVAKAHGGELRVTGAPGGGAKFIIDLPADGR